MRVLLIQPPFWDVNSPSLGLSSLKSALRNRGHDAQVMYSNHEFAEFIGKDDYEKIRMGFPLEALFGDLVFSSYILGREVNSEEVTKLIKGINRYHPGHCRTDEEVQSAYHSISRKAQQYLAHFKENAPWEDFGLVGLTTTFGLVPALAMAKVIHERTRDLPIILGGAQCEGTMGVAILKAFPWITYVARGEWEIEIGNFVENLEVGQEEVRGIAGLVWKTSEGIHEAEVCSARVSNLDELPVPDFADWIQSLEARGWRDRKNTRLPFESARGCWYGEKKKCLFCGLNGASTEFRKKSDNRVLNELKTQRSYQINNILWTDNILDPERFQHVIPSLGAETEKQINFVEIRPTIIKSQMIELKKAGFHYLQPGIESLNTKLLKTMHKGTHACGNVIFLKWAAEIGFSLFWNILHGIPGEKPEDYDQMTLLIPSIMHLFPPISGLNGIHIDRFSKLFELCESKRPVAAYGLVLGLDDLVLREIAYHFVGEANHDPELRASLARLSSAVQTWRSAIGKVAFISLDIGDHLLLQDTRPGATGEVTVLEGLKAKLLRTLSIAPTFALIESEYGKQTVVQDIIHEFLEQRWIARVDNRYIGLNIPAENIVTRRDFQNGVGADCYAKRLARYWNSIQIK